MTKFTAVLIVICLMTTTALVASTADTPTVTDESGSMFWGQTKATTDMNNAETPAPMEDVVSSPPVEPAPPTPPLGLCYFRLASAPPGSASGFARVSLQPLASPPWWGLLVEIEGIGVKSFIWDPVNECWVDSLDPESALAKIVQNEDGEWEVWGRNPLLPPPDDWQLIGYLEAIPS